jgi:FkbM family methyltransferase
MCVGIEASRGFNEAGLNSELTSNAWPGRRWLRDAMTNLFARLPLACKTWLYGRLLRPVLWTFFHLEKAPIVIVPAGPPDHRFKMKLLWQSHIVYALGIYEPEMIQFLQKQIRPADYCIDAGAHLGYLTILMALLVGEGGSITSFEAVPENFRVLEENVRINDLQNVSLQNVALAEKTGTLSIAVTAYQELSWTPSAVGYAVDKDQRTITVPAISLDDFLSNSGRKPAVIKIDVEGAELFVLRGASETLRRKRPVLFLEIHGWGTSSSQEVMSFLASLNYKVSIIGNRKEEAFCLALPKDVAAGIERESRGVSRA